MSWFSNLSFINPWAATFAALAPILIFAYLRRKPRNPKTVSAVFLLKELQRHVTIRRRVKPPLSFFFELLALLLIALAIAGPVLLDKSQTIAIVVDNTLSMRALSSDGTRMQSGKKLLETWLEEQDRDNCYALFQSSPNVEQRGGECLSATELISLFSSIQATLQSDSLTSAVAQLGESAAFDEILIISDRIRDFGNAPLSTKTSTNVKTLYVENPAENIYIRGVRFEPGSSAQKKAQILTQVAFSGEGSVNATVLVKKDRENTTIVQKRFSVSADTTREVAVVIPKSSARELGFHVSLALDSEKDRSRNAIREDDEAWVTSKSVGTNNILLVSPDRDTRRASGLSQIPNLSVKTASPEDYAKLSKTELRGYSFLLFHRTAPATAPPVSSLLVLPPPQNNLFPVISESTTPAITSWANEHPLTAYLRVPLLSPQRALVFDVPLWAQSIVNVEQGSILAAGESRGVRFAALGLELLPFEGRKTPAVSVLFLNLTRWLSGESELSSLVLTGSALQLEGDKEWVIATPTGEIESVSTTANEPGSYTFPQPGIFNVTSVGGKTTESISRESRFLAVNTIYPQESAINDDSYVLLPQTIPHSSVERDKLKPFWPLVLQLALAILLLEFFIRTLGARKRVG